MQQPRTALLFSVLLLMPSRQSFAETALSATLGGVQREPYWLILLGAVFIAGAIGLRHIKKPNRKDPLPQGPPPQAIEPSSHAH